MFFPYLVGLSVVLMTSTQKPVNSGSDGISDEWNILEASVGTEEIAHWEMIGTMIHQCLRDATLKDIEAAGLMGYYTMHSKGVYPADPNGVPFTAAYLQCTGDPIADITEDMAADAAMSKRQHFAQKKEELPRMAVLLSPLY